MLNLTLIEGVYCKRVKLENKKKNETIVFRQCHLQQHNVSCDTCSLNKHEQKLYPLNNSDYTQTECVACNTDGCNTATVAKYNILPSTVLISTALSIATYLQLAIRMDQ